MEHVALYQTAPIGFGMLGAGIFLGLCFVWALKKMQVAYRFGEVAQFSILVLLVISFLTAPGLVVSGLWWVAKDGQIDNKKTLANIEESYDIQLPDIEIPISGRSKDFEGGRLTVWDKSVSVCTTSSSLESKLPECPNDRLPNVDSDTTEQTRD